jgi:hypothetical protein
MQLEKLAIEGKKKGGHELAEIGECISRGRFARTIQPERISSNLLVGCIAWIDNSFQIAVRLEKLET